ncbi:hypothetical protein KDH_71690 [Dictyobacter sp. S3.2.2.5]|uniref:Uncharacterized protein n=1 Tax=Dictyobacter halimunensis TaxID=3026934 RepID=A0ABQ6G468_9CHLR|nr:hypothetical protein KDH_71690 [Dictyobacter sp. S3.2.2.5]
MASDEFLYCYSENDSSSPGDRAAKDNMDEYDGFKRHSRPEMQIGRGGRIYGANEAYTVRAASSTGNRAATAG